MIKKIVFVTASVLLFSSYAYSQLFTNQTQKGTQQTLEKSLSKTTPPPKSNEKEAQEQLKKEYYEQLEKAQERNENEEGVKEQKKPVEEPKKNPFEHWTKPQNTLKKYTQPTNPWAPKQAAPKEKSKTPPADERSPRTYDSFVDPRKNI